MVDLQRLYQSIDELSPEELEQVRDYVENRWKTTWWVVPAANLQKIDQLIKPVQEEAAQMSEDEVNALIDEAIDEVRRERGEWHDAS